MTKQTTGDFLATLRKANGYTQQEVAERLNISNRTLSSWETDRTLPDILILPAIADLFNVTVDELLRGERNNKTEKNGDISEHSLKNVYKNKFGEFTAKRALITSVALICIAVYIIACALALWTKVNAWLDWVLMIIGLIGLCVCVAVIAYQYNSIKLSIGMVFDEDITPDKKAFAAALKHKVENFMLICAMPFGAFALIALIVFIAANPQNGQILDFTFYVRYGYVFIICLNAALSAILLSAYLILKAISVKLYYNETQQATAKTNRKLAVRITAFACIPIILVIILNGLLALIFRNGDRTIYKFEDFDSFKAHMETLVVNGDYGIPLDEYALPLPNEKPENGAELDLGNGFYGTYYSSNFTTNSFGSLEYHKSYWAVTYGKPERFTQDGYIIELYQPTWHLNAIELSDGKFVVNARYHFRDYISVIENDGGKYCVLENISNTLSEVEIYTLTIVPICTVITCSVVYATKRKKQKYNF